MNIFSKINCDRCDVSPILPQGGGVHPASSPPSKLPPAEHPLNLRAGSTFGFNLGPLAVRSSHRHLARDLSFDVFSAITLGVPRLSLIARDISFSTGRNTTLAVRLPPLDFCAPPPDALLGLTVGPFAALSGPPSPTGSSELVVSGPTTSASFESFLLSVLRSSSLVPFGAHLVEHPLLPLHETQRRVPPRALMPWWFPLTG